MRRARAFLFAPIVASFFTGLEVFRNWASLALEGQGASWPRLAQVVLPVWATLIVVSPWCALVAGRFPFRSGRRVRAVFAHVAGVAVFVALHLVAIGLWAHVFGLARPRDLHAGVAHWYGVHATLDVSAYLGIVVVMLLLDARREASEHALAQSQLAERLASARLESLQAQIRPHFLFNTLNTLAVLSRKGDGAAVERALVDLGELLRATFDGEGRGEIPLGEELALVERYVALQRLRFPDRLEVAWRIDAEARSVPVPALLVQPLAENAIEHGLANVRGGHVWIEARRDGDALELIVADDGPGFGAARGAGEGLGLANTRERLALRYGAAGSLATGERAGGGAEVRVRLPWRAGATT